MKQKLARLKELDSNATKGPWKFDSGNLQIEREEDRFGICNFDDWHEEIEDFRRWYEREPSFNTDYHANGELICELRNALPDLLSYIDKQEKIIAVAKYCITEYATNPINVYPLAKSTLTEIETLEKGG